jgi:hypothetical protein
MSDPATRGDLPTERDDPALTDDRPADLASYDATPQVADGDVIDISDNAGPELTTGAADTGTETPPRTIPDDEP